MVVFLDLDDEAQDPHIDPRFSRSGFVSLELRSHSAVTDENSAQNSNKENEEKDPERPNPNVNGFSAILSCYPIVSQLAALLDLNSLHDLALTCRQFRANLLQYRDQLVKQTLRCSNETLPRGPLLADRIRQSREAWNDRGSGVSLMGPGRIQNGRVGKCARDMVGECRRCGEVVCRNCVIKAPPPNALAGRFRRLCKTCIKAPLDLLTEPTNDSDDAFEVHHDEDKGHIRVVHPSVLLQAHKSLIPDDQHNLPIAVEPAFTSSAFTRGPCSCPDGIFLCHECGKKLRPDDATYIHGWMWRTHYSAKLGGLGAGIGEGHEGVKCGRGRACLAARLVEAETECSAAELASLQRDLERVEVEGLGRSWEGTSYLAQEIEGVGGALKLKVRKQVRVGAVVREYEDERKGKRGGFLERERKGLVRSWCAWCDRVVPGTKDVDGGSERRGSSASSSGSEFECQ